MSGIKLKIFYSDYWLSQNSKSLSFGDNQQFNMVSEPTTTPSNWV